MAAATHLQLPDKPLVTIEPGKLWRVLDFRDLWAHRELLYFLTLRDVKVRYKQTVLGIGWVVLQPVLMTLIFTVFLGMLARVPSGGTPYALLVYSGLLGWTFFSTAVLGASQSLVANQHVITKIYFPRILVPAASVAGRLVDLVIAFLILVVLLAFYHYRSGYHVPLGWQLLLLPLIMIVLILFTLAMGTLFAAFNVRYRDVGIVLPVLIQLWMFVSPIVYPLELLPARWRVLYSLNPMVGLIQGFRAALLGAKVPALSIAMAIAVTGALLVIAILVFNQAEKTFADVV